MSDIFNDDGLKIGDGTSDVDTVQFAGVGEGDVVDVELVDGILIVDGDGGEISGVADDELRTSCDVRCDSDGSSERTVVTTSVDGCVGGNKKGIVVVIVFWIIIVDKKV